LRILRAVLVPLVLAAVCAVAWVTAVEVVRRADKPSVAAHRAEMTAEARLAATIIGRWMADARAQLSSPGGVRAALPSPWSGTGSQLVAANETLDRLEGGNFDAGFIIVDSRGFVVAQSSYWVGIGHLSRRSAAVDAALKGQDATGEVALDTLKRQLLIPVATPLTGPGGVTGALVGFTTQLAKGPLGGVVVAAGEALGHPVDVVTTGGTIVTPGDSKVIQRVDDEIAPAVAAAPKGPGVLEYTGEGKTKTVASFSPLPEGWSVVLPRTAASLAVTGDRATAAAAGAFGVVLFVAFVFTTGLYEVLRRRSSNVEESKKAFLAIAGHELRTPLTVMKGYTELLVERWDDVDDGTRRGILETVSYQVRNLEHLVERLLLGAQLEAGVAPATVQDTVALGPLLQETAQHQRGVAPTHRFVVDAPDDLTVRGDTTALNHVLTNLVENAVKYSPDGGTVTMRAEPAPRDRVSLTVDDEGIGLPGDLEIIFDKFVQREAVDRRVHDEGGVGLGLYIVRTLVEQMGGTVKAQRRSPKGSSFIVTLRRA
jgi:signal transduction histidine kinase